jgi:signal transduction histidine kinase
MAKARTRRRDVDAGHNGPNDGGKPTSAESYDSELSKKLWTFGAQFRNTNEPEKVLRSALRLGFQTFGATEGCIVSIPPGRDEPEILWREPSDGRWDEQLLTAFLRGFKHNVPPDTMLARIRRHQRMWGVLVIRNPGADFRWDARQAFSSIGSVVSQLVDDMDLARVREVRNRIDRKLLEQVRPKNLFYEILHGIRSLTGYDHSSALLMYNSDAGTLEIVAEQIAWRKAKGRMVRTKLELSTELRDLLLRSDIVGFDRTRSKGWENWNGENCTELAEMLDFHQGRTDPTEIVPENAVLCAPLKTRDRLLGILKIAAAHRGTFGAYEADLVNQFLPQAALALHGLQRLESLEMQVLAAERKHAMADLARGVSHDINNALGGVIPLVQQLRDELEAGELQPNLAVDDLREIERSLQLCRRVFGGMLRFARSMARNASEIYLHDALESTLSFVRDRMERRGVVVEVDLPASLNPIQGVSADIEQLLLNLINNADDSMSAGGRLTLRARQNEAWVELLVADTGCGIPVENLPKVQEAFFTTKSTGNGLGLAICRSIVSQIGGRMQIESRVGSGTRVTLMFPTTGDIG